MKKKLLSIFTFFILLVVFCNDSLAQNYQWAFRAGNNSDQQSNSVVVDGSGNTYITGYFKGIADFDPSPVTTYTAAALSVNGDLFFAKYGPSGNFIWAKTIGNAYATINGKSIAIDNSDNIYIAGHFGCTLGSVDFDPGPGTGNLTMVGAGGADVFFAKYNSAGTFIWAKGVGGVNFDQGTRIAVDASKNVYITGFFGAVGTSDFDPGVGTADLSSVGLQDLFFAKYDVNGNYIWAKSIGSVGNDGGNDIVVDVAGNIYLTGYFAGAADFDPGIGTVNIIPPGLGASFFAKYDSNGSYLWEKTIEVSSNAIDLDGTGNIYIAGQVSAIVDLDPGAGVANLTPVGSNDILFAKYDASGNYLWAHNVGSTAQDYCYDMEVLITGNIYLTGHFVATIDFDPGVGTATVTPGGVGDPYFAKYDSNGNYLWAKNVSSNSSSNAYGIAVDKYENCYITGALRYTCDFDPGTGTANLSAIGSASDIFLAKYSPIAVTYVTPACNGLCNGSITATHTGGVPPYTYVWSNSQTAQTISGLCAGGYTVTAIDGTQDTVVATANLDQPAVVSASITVTNPGSCTLSNGKLTAKAAGGTTPYAYVWSNGATTTAITGLTQGSYTVSITDANGCTYSNTAFITGNSSMTVSITPTSTTCNGGTNGTASVSVTNGTSPFTYLWSNNQTNQTITGLTAGNYAVTITDANGCMGFQTGVVAEPLAIVASFSVSNASSCSSNSAGTIASASGGTSPYSYLWSSGQTTSAISGIAAGNYSITITDFNSCTSTQAVTVGQSSVLTVTFNITNASSCISNNGTITTGVSGGDPSYTYSWSNGKIIPNITGLAPGGYTLTVTDSKGCTKTATATITCPTDIEQISVQTDIIVTPNPSDGVFAISGLATGELIVFNMLGERIFAQRVHDKGTVIDLRQWPGGIYFLQLQTEVFIVNKKLIISK